MPLQGEINVVAEGGKKEKIKIGKKNLPLLYVLHLIIVPLLFVAVKKINKISRDQFVNKLKFEKRKEKKGRGQLER